VSADDLTRRTRGRWLQRTVMLSLWPPVSSRAARLAIPPVPSPCTRKGHGTKVVRCW